MVAKRRNCMGSPFSWKGPQSHTNMGTLGSPKYYENGDGSLRSHMKMGTGVPILGVPIFTWHPGGNTPTTAPSCFQVTSIYNTAKMTVHHNTISAWVEQIHLHTFFTSLTSREDLYLANEGAWQRSKVNPFGGAALHRRLGTPMCQIRLVIKLLWCGWTFAQWLLKFYMYGFRGPRPFPLSHPSNFVWHIEGSKVLWLICACVIGNF